MEMAAAGGTACAVLNAANEAAVRLFLDGMISFNSIFEFVSAAAESITIVQKPSLDDILSCDREAREFVKGLA